MKIFVKNSINAWTSRNSRENSQELKQNSEKFNLPEIHGKIVNNSNKILSKFKQNPQKLNLLEIPVTSVAAKTTKKSLL